MDLYDIKKSIHLILRDYYFLFNSFFMLNKSSKKIIICNSFPKSGTHLLYQILGKTNLFNKWKWIISYQAMNGFTNKKSHFIWKFNASPNNSIVRTHLPYSEEILDILRNYNFKLIFIYRDLRDVAVSFSNWVCREPLYYLHDYYRNTLKNFDDRLKTTIQGIPQGAIFGENISLPDIGNYFRLWKDWINSGFFSVKFEELIGERGGGNEEVRINTIINIFNYLDINLTNEEIVKKFNFLTINPNESPTFRKGLGGKKGTWKDYFKEEHKKLFKKYAGDLLIELGYENDYNW